MEHLAQHLDERLDADLRAPVDETGDVALQREDRQPDLLAQQDVLYLPEAERLHVVHYPAHAAEGGFPADVRQAFEKGIGVGVAQVLTLAPHSSKNA
ncbi:MAG: hypothetical protein HW377_2588 [Actinobacteria bacterium]|nr:hypothetical protein [Actinomycetota bacterium]